MGDHDYGIYVQDTWRPIHRLTTLGVRADFVRRYDVLRNFEIEKSVEVAPPRRRAPAGRRREERRAGQLRARAPATDGRPGRRRGVLGNPTASSKTTYDANGDGILSLRW